MFQRAWPRRLTPAAAVAVALGAFVSAAMLVELSPKVESDFFFAPDDPQLDESNRIDEQFPGSPQVIVRVAADRSDQDLEGDVRDLTEALANWFFSVSDAGPDGFTATAMGIADRTGLRVRYTYSRTGESSWDESDPD